MWYFSVEELLTNPACNYCNNEQADYDFSHTVAAMFVFKHLAETAFNFTSVCCFHDVEIFNSSPQTPLYKRRGQLPKMGGEMEENSELK